MSLKKIISPVLVAALAVGSLVPLSSAASAHEWRHREGGNSVRIRQYSYNQHNNDGDYGEHRSHHGRNVAIGAFAAIVGLAIASQAARAHHDDDDDDDDDDHNNDYRN